MSATPLASRTTPTVSSGPPDQIEECLDFARRGDLPGVVEHLGRIRSDWGYAKRLRYARGLVNSQDENRVYAIVTPAPTDRGVFRTPVRSGRGRSDLTGERAAFNRDAAGGGAA